MHHLPLVSIITSSLNDLELLRDTIQNIGRQTYSRLEYIVIDGGSTDGTIGLLEQSSSVVDFWVSEPDFGIYDAWNKGLDLATGEYIAFLGAGDEYLPNAIEMLVERAVSNVDAEFIHGRLVLVGESKKERVIGRPWRWDIFSRYMCTTHVGALHSRKLFEKYGYFDISYRIAGDYEFLLRAGENLKTLFIGNVIAVMLAGGISQRGYGVLLEAFRAKLQHRTVSKVVGVWDLAVACAKFYIRKKFLN